MQKHRHHRVEPPAMAKIWQHATGEMIMVVAIVATSVSTVIYAVLERLL